MAIIIPTAASSFADSTTTEGPLRRYVLAQYRSDSDFEWVKMVRTILVTDELKYHVFVSARPQLRKQRELWHRIENGVGQATIIVIDPRAVEELVRDTLDKSEIERRR